MQHRQPGPGRLGFGPRDQPDDRPGARLHHRGLRDHLGQLRDRTLNNLVQVTSSNAISSTAQTGVCVTSLPHISVVKTPDAASVLAGNPVGFTISVKSDGMGTATSVNLTDVLPTLANANINWSISPAYAGQGTCAITGAAPSQTLSCSFGDMAQGAAVSVHVTSATTAPAGNTTLAPCQVSVTNYATNLNNSVQVTSATGGSATSVTGICVSINVLGNIHVVKVATPTLLPIGGGLVVYTYTVTNTGNVPLVERDADRQQVQPSRVRRWRHQQQRGAGPDRVVVLHLHGQHHGHDDQHRDGRRCHNDPTGHRLGRERRQGFRR